MNERVDRTDLRFAESVLEAFRFLTNEFGFRVTESTPTHVRYESRSLFLNFYHERLSYEIYVDLGRLADPEERRYELADVLGALADLEGQGTFFQASERERVAHCVRKIADLVKAHYVPALRNEPGALAAIDAESTRRSNTYTKKIVQGPIRATAQQAWRSQRYAKVKELYESIRSDLTSLERKRLDYAERHESKTTETHRD